MPGLFLYSRTAPARGRGRAGRRAARSIDEVLHPIAVYADQEERPWATAKILASGISAGGWRKINLAPFYGHRKPIWLRGFPARYVVEELVSDTISTLVFSSSLPAPKTPPALPSPTYRTYNTRAAAAANILSAPADVSASIASR